MAAAQISPGALRFGVNVGWMHVSGHLPPVEAARAAEDAGFDVVTAADHVGAASPFVVLAAAAAVTERVRLRTYVLDYGFWNPALLARDIATLDAISGGRVDLGLGAGHMRHEYEDVGLSFPSYAARLEGLAAFVAAVRSELDGDGLAPRPCQDRVPVLIGAMSQRGLELAVRDADLVALTGALQVAGQPPGTFRLASSAETDERVTHIRAARDRFGRPDVPLDALLQAVVLGQDLEEAAEALLATAPGSMTVAEVLDSPFVLVARTAEDAAAELTRRSARWGIGSWCVHAPSGPALAQVINVLRE